MYMLFKFNFLKSKSCVFLNCTSNAYEHYELRIILWVKSNHKSTSMQQVVIIPVTEAIVTFPYVFFFHRSQKKQGSNTVVLAAEG